MHRRLASLRDKDCLAVGDGLGLDQPMQHLDQYRAALMDQLERAFDDQRPALEKASDAVATALRNGHWIYFAGTGHSHLLALEMFYRAGGLVRAVPILDEDLMLHRSASTSTALEREEGRAGRLLDRYGVGGRDVLFVISNSGRNAVPVEFAMEGRARGAAVIAVTSVAHSGAHPSRHDSGRRLMEVADVVLDNAGVEGDAVVGLGDGLRTGATSTAVGAALLQAVMTEGAARALAAGWVPELYRSSNGGGELENNRLLERYRGVIPHL